MRKCMSCGKESKKGGWDFKRLNVPPEYYPPDSWQRRKILEGSSFGYAESSFCDDCYPVIRQAVAYRVATENAKRRSAEARGCLGFSALDVVIMVAVTLVGVVALSC